MRVFGIQKVQEELFSKDGHPLRGLFFEQLGTSVGYFGLAQKDDHDVKAYVSATVLPSLARY